MNKILFRLLVVITVATNSVSAYAETFVVDGIYYKTDWSDNTIAIVTYNEESFFNDDSYYKGNISIPTTVTHNGKQLRVTTIGSGAFSLCEELESVILSEGLLKIEDMAFSNCGISEITLPASLTSLSSSSFQSCNKLKSIHVVESNAKFCEIEGVLFDKAKETLICYPSGKGNSYVIPTGTKKIGKEAFAESQITNLTLNEGLVCIDDAAFSLTELRSITIPSSVTQFGKFIFEFSNPEYIISNILEPQNIPESTFDYAEYDSENEIYNNTVLYVPLGTESKYKSAIGWKRFVSIRECDRIEVDGFEYEVSYDSYTACLIKKPSDTNYSKESIVIPETILYKTKHIPVIGVAEKTFKSAWIESVTLSKNIQTIGSNAFSGCSFLKIVTAMMEEPISIEENVFEGVYGKATLVVPQKTKSAYSTTLPWSKFSSIKEADSEIIIDDLLYEIDFNSNTATLIKKNSFVYSSDEIEIPETITYNDQQISVTGIAKDAFKSTNLKSITFSKNISVIGNNAFSGCSNLKKIIVRNETPISINENVFEGVYDKATLIVPKGFLTIYQQAEVWKKFANIQEEITGDVETEDGFRVGGIYYEIDTNNPTKVKVVKHPDGYKGAISIPSQVAFKGSTYTVTGIGEDAFRSSSVEQISLPSSLTYIGSWAFSSSKIKTIEIPEGVSKIERYTFSNCSQLTTVQLPLSLTTIEASAFYSTAISEIVIRKFVSEIGTGVFGSCKNLISIKVEEGNETYDSRNNCNAVIRKSDSVLIVGCKNSLVPDGVRGIGADAFRGSSVEHISLPSSLTYIGSWAFSSSKIETIEIPEGVSKIERYAFSNCSQLTTVQLPSSLIAIGTSAFYSCSSLLDIVSQIDTPFIIDESVFGDSKGTIYLNAILSVPSLEAVEKYQETDGWKNFSNIQVIKPDPTPQIDNITFVVHTKTGYADIQSAAKNEHLVIPESIQFNNESYSVTRILDSAFEGSNMISLSIPSSITYIGKDVIAECNQLAAIEWSPKFKPTTEFVGHIGNPNLLFYVTEEQYKPDGIRNVIIGEKASSITLTDEAHGNFYCPKAFTAGNITYTHNYSLPTEKGLAQGWESIVLPFDVTAINTASGDVIKPVSIAGTGEKRFWLKELAETGFKEADSIRANIPYIISMPNWDGYQDFYNITGYISFSAQDVTVEATDIHPVTIGEYSFCPSFLVLDKSDDYYAINKDEYDGNAPGSVFVLDLRDIRPFEAYVTKSNAASAKRAISIADLMNGATAIADIPVNGERIYSDNGMVYIESAVAGSCHIYSISGQLVRAMELKAGTNSVGRLTKGIYVVNGAKVLVR